VARPIHLLSVFAHRTSRAGQGACLAEFRHAVTPSRRHADTG